MFQKIENIYYVQRRKDENRKKKEEQSRQKSRWKFIIPSFYYSVDAKNDGSTLVTIWKTSAPYRTEISPNAEDGLANQDKIPVEKKYKTRRINTVGPRSYLCGPRM